MNYKYLDDFFAYFNNNVINKSKSMDFEKLIKSKNILVDAKFGRGKTTLKDEIYNNFNTKIKLINEHTENNYDEYLIFDIDLFFMQTLSPIEAILLNILQHIKKQKNKFNTFWTHLANSIISILNLVSNNPKLNLIIKSIIGTINFIFKKNINIKIDPKKEIKKIIDSIYSKERKKIIFLFDEIDRCSIDFIKLFFQQTTWLFDNENIINIFFCNKDFIDKNYSLNTSNDENYLDKYFNYIYELPIKTSLFVIDLFRKNVIEQQDSFEFHPIFNDLINEFSIREIIRNIDDVNDLLKIYNSFLKWSKKNINYLLQKISKKYQDCRNYKMDVWIQLWFFLLLIFTDEENFFNKYSNILDNFDFSVYTHFQFLQMKIKKNNIKEDIIRNNIGFIESLSKICFCDYNAHTQILLKYFWESDEHKQLKINNDKINKISNFLTNLLYYVDGEYSR